MTQKERIGLKIVEMLHQITQAGYGVAFAGDFEGMIRIDYTKEYDKEFYHHEHLGFPGCDRKTLEKEIIRSLGAFIVEHVEVQDARGV